MCPHSNKRSPSLRRYGCIGLAGLALGACGRQPSESSSAAAVAASPRSALVLRPIETPARPGSSEPKLSAAVDGTVVLSWIEPIGDAFDHELKFARWNGAGWEPAAVAARGGDWFVNPADVPGVQPVAGSLWAAHWRVASSDDDAYDAMVAVSADAGASWSEPRLLNDDGTSTEHGFVTFFPWQQDVGVVWLDGRDAAREESVDTNGAPLGTALRYARLSADGAVVEQGVVDSLVCDCCTTGAASTGDGVAVVYRDRTPDEIPIDLAHFATRVRRFSRVEHHDQLLLASAALACCYIPGMASVAAPLQRWLMRIDDIILKAMPWAGRWAWYSILILEK